MVKDKFYNILFDLDGTLTDSAEGVTRSVQYALKKFGIESRPEDLKPFIGPPLQQSFKTFYGMSNEEVLRAVNYYRDYYRKKGIYENQLYPGIAAMIQNLFLGGKKLYVATSKPTVFAKIILEHFNLSRFFKEITGSNLDGTRVDKTEVISTVMDSLNYEDYKKTIMVGDRKHDITGAINNGLNSIGVRYGYSSPGELDRAGATYIVDSVDELSRLLLNKLN